MARTFFAPAAPDAIFERKPGIAVDRIIIHTTEGTFNGTIAWFQQGSPPRAVATASHYVVARDGAICQMVGDDKKCYHAGGYNSCSIGIEHEARTTMWEIRKDSYGRIRPVPFPINDFTLPLLQSSVLVTVAMCKKFGIPADRAHIIGHNEVPGATHTDPGILWPWELYMKLVRQGM